MDKNKRLYVVWRVLYTVVYPFLKMIYSYTPELVKPEGPCLIVANHVTNLDPLLLALSFPKTPIHFVASEHLFRLGWVSKLICWLVDPIPRRKGASGTATAMDCLRKIRSGRTVCIFAEGETTWDGKSAKVFPATGSLARVSGASLITYRFEGAYFTSPRWGKGIRRGRMLGRVVNVYTPDQLKKMTPAQIEEIMNRDIYEDAWERQKADPVKYKSRHLAESLEVALFMCPQCKKVGTLTGKGSAISCTCGFTRKITEYGVFDPAIPFENIAQWDEWQHEHLKNGDFDHAADLFSDENVTLFRLFADTTETQITAGAMSTDGENLTVGEKTFPLAEISDMALIQRKRLALMCGEDYYELRADRPRCLRKYLAVWRNAAEKAAAQKAAAE